MWKQTQREDNHVKTEAETGIRPRKTSKKPFLEDLESMDHHFKLLSKVVR